ncbi:MAG: nucleotide exchange factor GrpE [Bacteroidales bacterium]|nr:nucleotide exchange factor GrpE [Bacteroidales bacterium]
MSTQEKEQNEEIVNENVEETVDNNNTCEENEQVQEPQAEPTPEERIAELEAQLATEKKEYVFLMAEFDNFRKRNAKEKVELIKNAAEKAMNNILPIIDDFERAIQANATTDDVNAVREGVELIYNKLIKYLESFGVKAMNTTGETFDAEIHEAVTTFPAQSEDMKGKIIDTVQKGYSINDKVLRHAKVVVGQ